jgi:hypothetical protein
VSLKAIPVLSPCCSQRPVHHEGTKFPSHVTATVMLSPSARSQKWPWTDPLNPGAKINLSFLMVLLLLLL